MLIDTHILLWFHLSDVKLHPQEVESIIEAHQSNTLFLSSISIWEIAMLQKQERIALHQPIDKWIHYATNGINMLPISPEIALESVLLPHCEHKDPADRFIIATARIHNLTLFSKDQKIKDYSKLGYVQGYAETSVV